jgi:ethanolamine utilization protein EutL
VKLDLVPVKPQVLARRVIPDVEPQLAAELKLVPGRRALGLLTCTSDDALYVALDEGTKAAPVEVVYARSFYAGSGYPSGPLSGEVLGIYAGADPDHVQAALDRACGHLAQEAWFYAADERGRLAFFPHAIAALGNYLSKEAGLAPGRPMAYLIAPPAESVLALDAALKAAPVELVKWFGPPTETNFGGGWLAGDLDAVESAARAFAAAVVEVARHPQADRPVRAAGEMLGARPPGSGPGAGRYKVLATGERLADKPEHLTHLSSDEDLVPKTHPRIALRGKLDLLEAALLDAQVAASTAGVRSLTGELGEALEYVRQLVGAEVTGQPAPPVRLAGGLDAAAIRHASHHTWELYRVPFMYPEVRHGPVVSRINLARAITREAELAALAAFGRGLEPPEREDLLLGLNRLSSALYLLACKYVGGRYDEGPRPAGPVRGWRPPG